MRIRAIIAMLGLCLGLLIFFGIRSNGRAEASAGNCYDAGQGPSQPTICS
jgi:hypothetical protein